MLASNTPLLGVADYSSEPYLRALARIVPDDAPPMTLRHVMSVVDTVNGEFRDTWSLEPLAQRKRHGPPYNKRKAGKQRRQRRRFRQQERFRPDDE